MKDRFKEETAEELFVNLDKTPGSLPHNKRFSPVFGRSGLKKKENQRENQK